MNQEKWNKSSAKKLFDVFMEIEKSQYPEYLHEKLDERKNTVEKFILEFGVDHVRINNYTNMMQFSSAVILDVYQSGMGLNREDIEINIGSEPYELWITRGLEKFDLEEWKWKNNSISFGE